MSVSSSDSLGNSSDEDDNGDRSRDLLSSFYGTLAPQAEEVEDEEPAEPIDRSDFDADDYVRGMLKKQPMEALLATDDSLCREVKTLTSDMQSLVYENYSKFISATDTIRDMKENVGSMEAEMASLSATMAD
eukprot:CAMPEP_0119265148 /NCGR_PEP_ID=MMETSP1329-20130426/4046_1 /TAXON_ID=114041 /ORGANISM="Genus nov. species nov., Strain RCC1024" /LENGTH=131 /DNA_ID=CAMNT_0007264959 /DNA_START=85 /DNA_END=477 /DNA_ORIENTATION=+